MRRHLITTVAVLATVVISSSMMMAQRDGAQAQSPPHDPRDLSGVWQPTGYRSLSPTPPPMTPEGRARFEATRPGYGPRGVPPGGGNDPTGDCNPLGLTRMLTYPRPMEIIQIPGRVLQRWEWSYAHREIWADGRPLPEDPDPTWYGHSVGRWEGDTFVVETIRVDGRAWVDQFGHQQSDDMRLREEWRRLDRDHLELRMTLDDPAIYTEPWVGDPKIFQLQPGYVLRQDMCAPVDEQYFNRNIRNPAAGFGTPEGDPAR